MSGCVPEESEAQVKPTEFSNDFLLKIQTHDAYSTSGNLKKYIIKQLPPPLTQAPPLPLFSGLKRLGKNPKNSVAFLSFESEDSRKAALASLLGVKYRGRQWEEVEVSEADLAVTHRGSKRTREADSGDKEKIVTGPSTAPWEAVPYDEQIERKQKHCNRIFKVMRSNIRHQNVPDTTFRGVMKSTILRQYRNNVTLSCGYTVEGTPAIGFNAGSVADGNAAIAPITAEDSTSHPLVAAFATKILEIFARFNSGETPLIMFSKKTKSGFWRKVQVRHNIHEEFMFDFEFCLPATLDEAQQATVDAVTAALKDALTGSDAVGKVVSIQYHLFDGAAAAPHDLKRHVVFGSDTLTETLLGKQFEVSPTAFFQVNIPATEILLTAVAKEASLKPDSTILLDLCCGTGSIGLCLADQVARVIGVEMVPDAIDCAKRNAARNGVTNATYYCGKIEEVLRGVLERLPPGATDIVAILDPPRCGVHSSVIKWIRQIPAVQKVVYISCDQSALERDSPGFLKPATNAFRGAPLTIESAFGVDLFPQTQHVEMVAVMSRPPLVLPSAAAEVTAQTETAKESEAAE